MAKKTEKEITKITSNIMKLMPEYVEVKQAYDNYKKKEAELNKQIKEAMAETELDKWSWETDKGIVEYSTRQSDEYDEEALLDYLHKHKEFTSCIKTKEYIDQNELENILYNEKVSKRLMLGIDKFRTSKTTQVLKIKKIKEKK